MNLLRFILKKAKYEMCLGIFLSAISGALQAILMIRFTHAVIDFIKSSEATSLMPLILLSLCFVVIQLFSKIVLNRLNKVVIFQLQEGLARYVLDTSYRHFERQGKSNYYATFTQDIGNIAMFINGLPTLLNTCMMALSIMIYLTWYSKAAMLFIVPIFLPLFVIYILLDHFVMQKYVKRAREVWDAWFKTLRALLEGKKELTVYQSLRDHFSDQDIHEAAVRCNAANYKANNAYSYAQTIWSVANYGVLIGILVFSQHHFVKNTSSLLVFFSLIMYVLGAFISINMFFPVIRRCIVSLKKIRTLVGEDIVFERASTAVFAESKNIEIYFKDICLALKNKENEDPFTLGPVSFSIKTNQISFIVGKNGSGKSTLVKIITGLYWADRGNILVNDEILTMTCLSEYCSLFSVIFYDFFLFDNLLKYCTPEQKKRFYTALRDLKIDYAVKVVNNCILTEALSDGQRKRLALASAFLYNRPFMIFDEWASDQDPEFKSYFYKTIIPNLKADGKGVVVISHDPLFFNTGDQLINLDLLVRRDPVLHLVNFEKTIII